MQQRWYYYSYAWYVVIIIHHTGNILITRPSAPMAMALRAHATPPRVVCSLLSGRAIRIDDIRPFPTRTDYQEEVQVCCKTCSEHFDCIHRTVYSSSIHCSVTALCIHVESEQGAWRLRISAAHCS